MEISASKLVTLEYKLSVKKEGGQLEKMEETTPEQPLQFFHGMGMMLPKFEENLTGKSEGDTFEFMLACEDAYGHFDEANIIELPRNIFEQDGKLDTEKIYAEAIVPLVDNEGNRINALVKAVNDEFVTVDLNHPLADEDLYFEGRILKVEQPSEEELAKMMQTEEGGGCSGCSGCGDGDCGDGGCGEGGCC
ncbi:FKBP-type peptidyl-prolyl cis-trans isomerase [Gammaproteobacteria bacterium]|nr:FKBP-type peptidyl-prolyl cis-trans isomerase [Gammaproteobacteria bacterium]